MARDLNEAAEILKEHGLDLKKVLQDTHAETMMRLGSLVDERLELTLKIVALKRGKPLNDAAFLKGGKLGTLAAKIRRAKDWGLLDDTAHKDATTVREIRNEFGHPGSRLHFDSDEIVQWVKQLSTYDAAPDHQAAIFAVTSNIMKQLDVAANSP